MKKFNTLLIAMFLLSGLILLSCSKDDDCLTGKVRFTNTSSNPYDLYIDGEYQLRISGNTFQERDLSEGQHTGRVEQVSGFILFPTIVENTLNVFGCKESEWVFP